MPELRRGNDAEPESLHPHQVRSIAAQSIVRDLSEGLVRLDGRGEIVPGLAARWEVSDDGLRYRFELRQDARWSNGEPIDAAAVVTSLRRLVDPAQASFYGDLLSAVANARAILAGDADPQTLGVAARETHVLEISLAEPIGHFLNLLALPPAAVAWPTSDGAEITSGAYRLVRWGVGDRIELTRNAHYWDSANVAIPNVVYFPLPDALAELNRFRAGELDITANVPGPQFEQVQRSYPDQLRIGPYLATYYYGFNLKSQTFRDNVALRQALSLAIDRNVIAESITGRGEIAAVGWVPTAMPNYRSAFADPEQTRGDRERARALFAQAGFGPDNPLALTLRYNTEATHQRIAVAVAAMWKQVLGVETRLANEELRVYLNRVRALGADVEIFRLSWVADYADPATFLDLFTSTNPANPVGFADSEFDALVARAGVASGGQRMVLYAQAEQRLIEQQAILPLYSYVSKHLVSDRVGGFESNSLDVHPSQDLYFR